MCANEAGAAHPWELKTATASHAGENGEKRDSHAAGKNEPGAAALEISWAISFQTKHVVAIGPRRTPGNFSQRNENHAHTKAAHKCSQRFYWNSPNTENNPDVLWQAAVHSALILRNEKERTIETGGDLNRPQGNYIEWGRSPFQKITCCEMVL